MSTMLSDKVEQVSGATGGGSTETSSAGTSAQSELNDRTWGGAGDEPQEGGVATQTRQALSGVKDAVQADATEIMYRVEDYVIDHPIKSLCIAAGVGFLLGVMWSH